MTKKDGKRYGIGGLIRRPSLINIAVPFVSKSSITLNLMSNTKSRPLVANLTNTTSIHSALKLGSIECRPTTRIDIPAPFVNKSSP